MDRSTEIHALLAVINSHNVAPDVKDLAQAQLRILLSNLA